MTTKEASDRLGISVGAVQQAHYRGRIEGRLVGRVLVLDPRSVRRYGRDRRNQGTGRGRSK